MILQNVVWTIWLAGAALIALGFIFVIVQAGKPTDDEGTRKANHASHVLQAWAFVVLFVVLVVGSWATLSRFPIPPQNGTLDAQQVVQVVGRQWSWQITPNTVKAGEVVEFRVTSDDVNHGFAVYAPDGRIVTQTQAMPGYTNKLLYTFAQPGDYTVQCLEYCGLGHAPMHAVFHVLGPGAGLAPAGKAAPVAAAAGAPVDGAQLFSANCAACHQATGLGIPGAFPPLKGNTAVNSNDPAKHIEVVLNGLHGETLDGKTYSGVMTPFKGVLDDEEIAAIINYERSSWGNHGSPVTAAQVAAERGKGP
jgi:cytochrome c oxidase subunit 2